MRQGSPSAAVIGLAALCAIGLAAGLVQAAEKAGGYHKNEAWGFKVRTPHKWNVIHMSSKEQWIALKAIGPRDLYGPKGEGWGMRPEMWVIAFPHARQDDRGAKREKIDENTWLISVENPYKDYPDFVKREKRLALGGAGFYFSVEEETERDGMQVDIFEIKAEKMTDTPIRMLCWVYHTKDVDYAIQFKLPANHFEDYESTMLTCVKSFKEIARTQAMPGASSTGSDFMDVEREKDMTPEQRKRKRIDEVERYIADEVANLPEDWLHMENDHFVVISHADKKFSKRILEHATHIRAYLEKEFPGLGDDYVPRGILRIFRDDAEESAFREGTRSIWFMDADSQVFVSGDKDWSQLWEFERVSRDVTRMWLYFKNKNLYGSMPYWLRNGLVGHMEKARPSKSRKLRFAPDASDVLSLVKLAKSDKAIEIKELFLNGPTKKEEESGDPNTTIFSTDMDHVLQAESVFHYLMTKGDRGKFKGSVRRYLQELVTAIEEEDKKFEEEEAKRRKAEEEAWKKKVEENGGKPPEESEEDEKKAEEEARERWKEHARRLEAKRQAIAKRCFDAAFGEVDDKGWRRLDRSWLKYAEKGGT